MKVETTIEAGSGSGPSRRLTGALFFVAAAAAGLGHVAASSRGVGADFSPLFVTLSISWLVAFWIETDGKRGKKFHVWDLGFFLFFTWIVVGPYYMLKTRGARGLLPVLGIFGAYFFSAVLASLLLRR